MKKAIAFLLCIALCLSLVPSVMADTAQQHLCTKCNQSVTWTAFSSGKAQLQQEGHYHLYLSENYTGTQISLPAGVELCLDLYGNDMYTDGRAFNLTSGAKLNVIDSLGGGTVTGTSSNGNPAGGTILINAGAEMNIYGGEFTAVQDGTGYGIGCGGVFYINGTLNLYGGTIRGTDLVMADYGLSANGYGATIYMAGSSVLNVSGGEILSGTLPDGGIAECVGLYTTTATVNVSGSGSVEEIYCPGNYKQLTVSGVYTGTTNIRFPDSVTVTENMAVANAVDADVSEAKLRCRNGNFALLPKDGELVTATFGLDTVAAVCTPEGMIGYDSLQEAVDACGDGYIKLLNSTDVAATVEKDLYIDANGQSAVLTLAEGVTLYGFDSQTDDYTVADGNYGKLTVTGGTVVGLPEESELAEDRYLAVTEDGKVSFHRVKLQIYAMSLRAKEVGLYYKSYFLGDEVVAKQVAKFGVVLSVKDVPTVETMETTCKYTAFSKFESGAGGNTSGTSSLVRGFMKPRNDDEVNARNLDINVYGRPYVRLTDGTVLMGESVVRSLAEQLKLVDKQPEKLSVAQMDGVIDLYNQYETVLKNLQMTNLLMIMDQTEVEATLQLIAGGKTDYVIVHDGSSGGQTLASQLVKIFKDVYGVTLQSYASGEKEEGPYEIVVGMARGIAHRTARKFTGLFDFGMYMEQDKLILCGKNDLCLEYLGQYLKREVFTDKGSTELIMDSDDNLLYSNSDLTDTTYVDYWMEENSSVTLDKHFSYEVYSNADTTLPYRLYVPFNYDPDKEYPLLVTLHGAGLRGTNNTRQLAHINYAWQDPEQSADEAIIIYPQCPEEQKWVDTDWTKGSYSLKNTPESNELKAVMELVAQLQKKYSIDDSRIYAIGYSMGGYGTWNLLMNHPDVFAAGVPMCGAADPSMAEVLAQIPIWTVHGVKDPTVPVSGSRDMAAAIAQYDPVDFHYTELPEHEHDVWNYTYQNAEIMKWLFSQKKS
ncbi:MAG: prolyl oligopeptidase family serine peptidase [Oscillospiraceae bacterium]|nr:prolyl oligopeptidase family serine peptidase [Oscillospiraceae bacterium]